MSLDMQREELLAAASDSDEVKTLKNGAIAVYTGKCTGRSPNAKSIVVDNETENAIDWESNNKMTVDDWSALLLKARSFELNNSVIKQTLYAGRDETHQLQLSVKTSKA